MNQRAKPWNRKLMRWIYSINWDIASKDGMIFFVLGCCIGLVIGILQNQHRILSLFE